MNKSTLRSLALGFLASGILTGAYAIFFQGNVPVQGITGPSVLKVNETQHADELNQYRDEMSSLITERDSLEMTNENLGEEVSSLTKAHSELENELAGLNLDNRSSESNEETSGDDESTNEAETETTSDEETEIANSDTETEVTEAVSGTFSISDGQSSVDIASQLEAEGYIESAPEFQALLDEWGLNSILQAGSYELDSSMSIHDIATELTHGAYYYY